MERFLIEKNVRKNFQNFSQKFSRRLPSLFSSIFFEFFYTIVLLMTYSNKLDCVRGFLKKSRLGWVSPLTKLFYNMFKILYLLKIVMFNLFQFLILMDLVKSIVRLKVKSSITWRTGIIVPPQRPSALPGWLTREI